LAYRHVEPKVERC